MKPEPPLTPQNTILAPSKRETWIGLAYIPFHLFFVASIAELILRTLGRPFSTVELNLVSLLISTVVLMLTMRQFLQASFVRFRAFGTRNLPVLAKGYILRILLNVPILLALSFLIPAELPNPNQDVVTGMVNTYFIPSLFLVVVLAPIVEEILFRGILFSLLYRRNRTLAYVASTLLFALIHVMIFLVLDFHLHLLLTMLLYIPAGIAFCWTYEKSGNILTPILLHGIMNFIAASSG